MKLESLTNTTVVDDAIMFVASHVALPKTVENANSYNSLTLNEERVDVQGTKEISTPLSSSRQQQTTLFSNRILNKHSGMGN
jgi:hypothetical protein